MDQHQKIIHLDLDAFYCAVEEQRDPNLRGIPFAVGGSPTGRGVVSSCSYAARAFGVRSAMPMARAVRLCPELKVVSSHFKEYREASRNVMNILQDLTPLVEQISIDEAFLDISDLSQPAKHVAGSLQKSILEKLSLPNSLGIAANKLVAKIATDVGKMTSQKGIPPNAITLVPPGEEAGFLAPLPVQMLWGVGPKTAEKLAAIGVRSIGDLAAINEIDLMRRFGKNGYDLAQRAKGIDNRPIITEREAKSISQEVTFSKDIRDEAELRRRIQQQAHHVAKSLQKKGLTARTVKIKLRWSNFETITRQTTMGQPTNEGEIIANTATQLFLATWQGKRLVRLIGVGVSGFDTSAQQLGLWDKDWDKENRIQKTITDLQSRFGDDILIRGFSENEHL